MKDDVLKSPVRPVKRVEGGKSATPKKKVSMREQDEKDKPYIFRSIRSPKPELKNYDKIWVENFPTTLQVFHVPLTSITEGNGDNQRRTRKIFIKSIYWAMYYQIDPTKIPYDVQGYQQLRLYLVLDRQANGQQMVVNDCFEYTSNWQIAVPNLDNAQRFQILKDMRVEMRPTAHNGTNWNWPNGYLTFYRKLNIQIDYTGPVGDMSQISNNNLYLVGATTGSSVGTFCQAISRVRFSDQC